MENEKRIEFGRSKIKCEGVKKDKNGSVSKFAEYSLTSSEGTFYFDSFYDNKDKITGVFDYVILGLMSKEWNGRHFVSLSLLKVGEKQEDRSKKQEERPKKQVDEDLPF